MRDALPHLFEANPRLLYQLVTMVSPMELQVGAGLPWWLCVALCLRLHSCQPSAFARLLAAQCVLVPAGDSSSVQRVCAPFCLRVACACCSSQSPRANCLST